MEGDELGNKLTGARVGILVSFPVGAEDGVGVGCREVLEGREGDELGIGERVELVSGETCSAKHKATRVPIMNILIVIIRVV